MLKSTCHERSFLLDSRVPIGPKCNDRAGMLFAGPPSMLRRKKPAFSYSIKYKTVLLFNSKIPSILILTSKFTFCTSLAHPHLRSLCFILNPWASWTTMFGLPILHHAIPTLILLGIGGILYTVVLSIWRLYFSPIAKFPGPKIAALTYWYAVQFFLPSPLTPLTIMRILFYF